MVAGKDRSGGRYEGAALLLGVLGRCFKEREGGGSGQIVGISGALPFLVSPCCS
jgi:hypothetical protein